MVHNVVNFVKKKPQLTDFLYKLQVVIRVFESVFVSLFGVWWYCAVGWGMCVVVWKNGRHFRLGEMPPLFVLNPDFGDCQLAGVHVILLPLLLCR